MPQLEHTQLKIQPDERMRLGLDIQQKIDAARDGMRELLNKLTKFDDWYEGKLPPKNFPWEGCANVNVPMIQYVTDTYHAHTNDVIYGVKPYTLIQAIEPADKERSQVWEDMLYNMEAKQMKLCEVGDMVNLNALKHGTAITKLPWREEYRTVKDEEDDGFGNNRVVESQEVKYRGPKVELVDLRNFVIWPLTAASVEDADGVGDRYTLSLDQVRRRMKDGRFDPKYTQAVLDAPDNESSNSAHSEMDSSNGYQGIERIDHEELSFWEVITGYDVNGDGLNEDCLITIEEKTGTIVCIKEYPWWHGRRHYIRWCPFPRPGKFFGRAVPEILEHIQKEMNAVMNQWLDSNSIAIAKMFKLRKGSGKRADDLKIGPGAVIELDSVDDLQELQISPVMSGIDVLSILRDFGERASAINDASLGRQTEGDKTAKEVAIVNSEGSIRFSDVIRRLQSSMVEIAEQVQGLCYQFMDDEEVYNLVGKSINPTNTTNDVGRQQQVMAQIQQALQEAQARGATPDMMQQIEQMLMQQAQQVLSQPDIPLKRADLKTKFDYLPHGNTGTANKTQQREEALLLYREMGKNPLILQDPMKIYRLTKDVLNAFGRTDFESYIGTEEELKAQIQQQQQMQAQQQQMVQEQAAKEMAIKEKQAGMGEMEAQARVANMLAGD